MMDGLAFWALPILVTMQLQSTTYSTRHPLLEAQDFVYLEQNVPGVKCPDGYFKCQTETKCITARLHCDGIVQCPDASDERDCEFEELDELYEFGESDESDESDESENAENSYWDHMFRKRPQSMHDDIPEGVCLLKGVNSTCVCHSFDMLCDRRNLTSIPLDLPNTNMIMLDLSENNFTHISSSFLDGMPNVSVEVVILKFCEVTTIAPGAFNRATELRFRTIFLSQNNIEKLEGPMFSAGNGMFDLMLSANRISGLYANAFQHLEQLEELDLRNNLIEGFDRKVFEPLKRIKRLYLCYNRIKHLRDGMFPPLPLGELSLIQNRIKTIGRKSLPFSQLLYLYMDSNEVSRLEDYTFCNATQLKSLVLLKNKLHLISLHAFACIKQLMILNLDGNPLEFVDQRSFQNLTNLNKVYFSKFQLCQAVPHVRKQCLPTKDGISTRRNLLDNSSIRAGIILLTPVILFGNVLMLLWNWKTKTTIYNFGHQMYQNCLAISDFCMGVYLAPIAFADIYSRDEFIKIAYEWTHGGICSVMGFLNTVSYQSSAFMLMLITWERLMSVSKTIQNRDTRPKTIFIQIAIVYITSIALAAIPFTDRKYFGRIFYENNALCLPLSIKYYSGKGWQYSALLYFGTTLTAIVFICACYLRICYILLYTPMGRRQRRSGQEKAMSRRFSEMLYMNVCCWLCVLVHLLFDKKKYIMYPWLVLVVIPFKSAWNPVTYFSVTYKRKEHLTHPEEPVIPDIRMMEIHLPQRPPPQQPAAAQPTAAQPAAAQPAPAQPRLNRIPQRSVQRPPLRAASEPLNTGASTSTASKIGRVLKKQTKKSAKNAGDDLPEWATELWTN